MTDRPAPADIEVEVEDEAWIAELGLKLAEIEALMIKACSAALSAPRLTDLKGGAVVILLTDDAAVHDLNARFRGQDKTTNVLSFPAVANLEGHLGDIALALGVCAREAQEQGKSLANHACHMTVHGTLHLLGYDHDIDAEAEVMEALERTLLADLGVPDPYGAPAQDHG
jgi:probable rRNA maturation factor